MKFVFDFDRVLFDTDQFVKDLRSAHVYDEGVTRNVSLLADAKESGINLEDYVNQEAVAFLKQHGGESAIVSSFQSRYDDNNSGSDDEIAEFQREKIMQSGLGILVNQVYVTAGDKTDALREVYSEGSFFVDDEPSNVEVAHDIGYRSIFFGTPKNMFHNPEKIRDHSISTVMENTEIMKVTSFEKFIELVTEWENKH